MDMSALKQYWPMLKGVGGGLFTLLFTLSLLQGLVVGRKQTKMLKQQEEAARQQQGMMSQLVPGFSLDSSQLGQLGVGAGMPGPMGQAAPPGPQVPGLM